MALSPAGVIAVVPNSERYQILRIDDGGNHLPAITRAIERVRRTPAEEAALKARISRGMGAVRAAAEQSTGKAPSSSGAVHAPDLTFKPHVAVDGIRFDAMGRLWVRTMRGDEAHTVFDLFSASGEFLGSVSLDGEIYHFAFGGHWMLTSGEDADGVPQVTRWALRERR